MMQYNTIAELQNYIVLDNYVKSSIACEPPAGYQTEAALERELIDDLKNQGYEYVPEITSPDALLTNARKQLQKRCTRTISMTSYLTMGIFKIFIW